MQGSGIKIMKVFIGGNGNLSFEDFCHYYATALNKLLEKNSDAHFLVCDFRGVDVLAMEYLKCRTSNVMVHHMGSRARYVPDQFRTYVNEWKFIGGYSNNWERDQATLKDCTHYLAYDFNSDQSRKSGTQKNIEVCQRMGKIFLPDELGKK